MSWYTTYGSAMLFATRNRLFQINSETRTIEIDDSIVRRYASDTERDRESYTEVCGVEQPGRCLPCLNFKLTVSIQFHETAEKQAFSVAATLR